jgi:hypothetical protein
MENGWRDELNRNGNGRSDLTIFPGGLVVAAAERRGCRGGGTRRGRAYLYGLGETLAVDTGVSGNTPRDGEARFGLVGTGIGPGFKLQFGPFVF